MGSYYENPKKDIANFYGASSSVFFAACTLAAEDEIGDYVLTTEQEPWKIGEVAAELEQAEIEPLHIEWITSSATTIAAGGYSSFVIQADGGVWTWGCNMYGQLGDGTQEARDRPSQIMGNTMLDDL